MALFTPKNYQQIYNALEGYIVGSPSNITNFNIGSRNRTLLEAFALVSGQTHYIFYQALLDSIPIAIYEGFGFARKEGDKAGGLVTLGVDDAVIGDTLFPSKIVITAEGNDYETTLPFVIKDTETQNSIVIPFEITTIFDQGLWDASTNTPSIPTAGAGNRGWYYEVSVAGTPPSGPPEIQIPWLVGEWVISDGTKWHKASPGDVPILSVEAGSDKDLAIGDIDTKNGLGSFADDYGLDFAKNNNVIAGGTDAESDDARRERFFEYVNGLTRTNPSGILSGALSVAGVSSAYLLENYPNNGWNTLYIDDGTGSSNPPLFAEVSKVILGDDEDPLNYPGYRAAGTKLNILPPNKKTIDITLLIYIDELTLENPTDIENLAATAVENYINTLKLGFDVIKTEITTAVQNSHADIIDVDITEMKVNSVPVSIGNVEIDFDEVAKIGVTTTSHVLISKV